MMTSEALATSDPNPAAGDDRQPVLRVNNIEVIYDHVILVLKGVSLDVPKGGIVSVIELNSEKWSGGTKAFKECLEVNDIRLRKFPADPWISYFEVE